MVLIGYLCKGGSVDDKDVDGDIQVKTTLKDGKVSSGEMTVNPSFFTLIGGATTPRFSSTLRGATGTAISSSITAGASGIGSVTLVMIHSGTNMG